MPIALDRPAAAAAPPSGAAPLRARPGPHASILETIGRTPVVRINHLGPAHAALYAKLEAFNPMGSVKDRLALSVIEAAERSGALTPGQTVIEATSGNTGVGLAMVCAQKGYPLVIVMGENFSVERRKLMRFLGAKVILTPAVARGTGMMAMAERLAETHGWFLCRQFETEANAAIHAATTAREILDDFAEIGLDYWVSGVGTGGTVKGVAGVLKRESPATRIVVAEPDNAPLLRAPELQRRRPDGAPARSHPHSRPHAIQGWTPDFISKLAGDAIAAGVIDQIEPVTGHEALAMARALARREGIFCGVSGGATVAAALRMAEAAPPGARILAMIPDTGERYLSTPLFDGIEEEMTEEERRIAASAPPPARRSRTGAAPHSDHAPARAAEAPCPKAEAYLDNLIEDAGAPVLTFSLEWCEFCWSLHRLFEAAGVASRNVDLDAAPLREDGLGRRALMALFARTGQRTVPQVFIGGAFFGGAEDVVAAYESGALQERLRAVGAPITRAIDARSFLPAWAQPRAEGAER